MQIKYITIFSSSLVNFSYSLSWAWPTLCFGFWETLRSRTNCNQTTFVTFSLHNFSWAKSNKRILTTLVPYSKNHHLIIFIFITSYSILNHFLKSFSTRKFSFLLKVTISPYTYIRSWKPIQILEYLFKYSL